jgi:hypothetical protein
MDPDPEIMANSDRRSGIDRRTIQRRNVSIDVEWENSDGRRTGTVSDLSEAGCFVLSSGEVSPGDKVKVLLPLGDGMKVQVLGEVRNQVFEIGFALRFIEPTEAQADVITGLMAKYGEYL